MHKGSEEVNNYLVGCLESKKGFIVDAGGFTNETISDIQDNDLEITHLIITHNHYDHTEAIPEILKWKSDITIVAGDNSLFKSVFVPKSGEEINIGDLTIRLDYLPGHTDDMLIASIPGHIFTGDVLFAGSVGGTSGYDEFIMQIQGIRKHIFCHSDITTLHSGHGPESTIGLEKLYNPFL